MFKFFADKDVLKLEICENHILLIAPDESKESIKQAANICNINGIYCRKGNIIDTNNGVIIKISKNIDFDYKIMLNNFCGQLDNISDYESFAMFIEYRVYFKKLDCIGLYWDETKAICIYEKTTMMDKLGGGSLRSVFKPIKQINVNSKIIKKIQLKPNLEDTLKTFVDKYEIGDFYERANLNKK